MRFSRNRTYAVELTAQQESQVESYRQWLNQWNKQLHLTSIQNDSEIWQHHFVESFWLADHFLPTGTHVVDIGSGAGFPGLAMKLYRPDLEMTLIEQNYRKWVFLRELSRALALELHLFQAPAESYPAWRNAQIATLRGLQPSALLLQKLAQQGPPLLVLHGRRVAASLNQWVRLRSEKVPASRNRYATLLEPPQSPSRDPGFT